MPETADDRAHGRRRLTGRDPLEPHRSATPLELLYDLTIVVAIGTAANELAHYVADDHVLAGVPGFAFAAFAVSWAWINYSWFASAYDTDDWVFRLATMVQMVGVIVLALGLQQTFASIDHGATLDNGVMVAGLRRDAHLDGVPLGAGRAARPRHSSLRADLSLDDLLAQVGWVALVFLELPVDETFALAAVLLAIEVAGPVIARAPHGGTPWNAEHIAERYGLLVIITLGEGIIGTVAAVNAVVHGYEGWTVDAAVVAIAGVGLTFGTWWTYFAIPWAARCRPHRDGRSSGATAISSIFGGLAAIGAGLHVAALFLEHETRSAPVATVLSAVLPLALYVGALYTVYSACTREADPFHLWLMAGTAAVLAHGGRPRHRSASASPVCLIVLMFAPPVTVVGYETHRAPARRGRIRRASAANAPELSRDDAR